MFLQWGIMMQDNLLKCDKLPLSTGILTNIDINVIVPQYGGAGSSYNTRLFNEYVDLEGAGGAGYISSQPLNIHKRYGYLRYETNINFDTIFVFDSNNFKDDENRKTFMEWNNLNCYIEKIFKNLNTTVFADVNYKTNICFHTLNLLGCFPHKTTTTIKNDKTYATINWIADCYQLDDEDIPVIINLLKEQERKLCI